MTILEEFEESRNDAFLCYDYIGVEISGDFDTFHCHNIGNDLSDKFILPLNQFGLFENNNNSLQVLDYLNVKNNGCEPVPCFIAKTKFVTKEKATSNR